jgi:hypothetical protein
MSMKRFKDLEVTGGKAQLEAFIAAVESRLDHGWQRSVELEKRIADSSPEMVAFQCTAAGNRKAAALWLAKRRADALYVTNVVPSEQSRLSHDEYNAVLDDFVSRLAAPVAKSTGVQIALGQDEFDIDECFPPKTLERLRRFASSANPATGSAHPSDQEYWFEFVVAAHHESASWEVNRLGRWLTEEVGWDADVVFELQIEYERERALLEFYDGSRR